jgi:hypothetical protein
MSGTVAISTYSLSETIRQTAVTKSELKDFHVLGRTLKCYSFGRKWCSNPFRQESHEIQREKQVSTPERTDRDQEDPTEKAIPPPHFEVLTPEQAKDRLMEKGVPGEAATERLLKAASKIATDLQRSNAADAKVRQINSKKSD